MFVKILNVDVEHVKKGKSQYSVATVAYMSGGEARTQKIISFANPDVYKKVTDPSVVGQEFNVTVTKNEAGYNQWSSLGNEASAPAPSVAPTSSNTGTRVTGSTYETPAERAIKQVYIVKQSSISAAIALAAQNQEEHSPQEIINVAQQFVDYVFNKEPVDDSIESMKNDIPY